MKRGTVDHPKMKRLARFLGLEIWGAVGIMECLWQWAAEFTLRGDIGRYDDDEIADAVGWTGDPSVLMDALINARWIDRDDEHRLIIHDWPEHCEDNVHSRLARAGEVFANGQIPKLSKITKEDRADVAKAYEQRKKKEVAPGGARRQPPPNEVAPGGSNALPSVALPSVAKRSVREGAAPPAAEPSAESPLAEELATAIETAGKRRASPTAHAARVAAIAKRIEELGAEEVATAIRWICTDPAGAVILKPLVDHPDGVSAREHNGRTIDRIEQAIRLMPERADPVIEKQRAIEEDSDNRRFQREPGGPMETKREYVERLWQQLEEWCTENRKPNTQTREEFFAEYGIEAAHV